jgi:hypothetical protein
MAFRVLFLPYMTCLIKITNLRLVIFIKKAICGRNSTGKAIKYLIETQIITQRD